MIDNPAYKGPWAPREIPNPEYYEHATSPKMSPIVRGPRLHSSRLGDIWLTAHADPAACARRSGGGGL